MARAEHRWREPWRSGHRSLGRSHSHRHQGQHIRARKGATVHDTLHLQPLCDLREPHVQPDRCRYVDRRRKDAAPDGEDELQAGYTHAACSAEGEAGDTGVQWRSCGERSRNMISGLKTQRIMTVCRWELLNDYDLIFTTNVNQSIVVL